jgi:hypothetical protein
MAGLFVNNELKDLEGNDRGIFEVLSRHFPGVAEKTHEDRIVGVLADMRIEHLPNTNLERYLYGKLLGFTRVKATEALCRTTMSFRYSDY